MAIGAHVAAVPSKAPDFFLASTTGPGSAQLDGAVRALADGPGATARLQVDTRQSVLSTDQSSLAALNISGLVDLDRTFALAMAVVAVAIFVFGLLLQRRREYVTLRAQGLAAGVVRRLITAEATTVAVAGVVAGTVVGLIMGSSFVAVLRPLFVLTPAYRVSVPSIAVPAALVGVATVAASLLAARLVAGLDPAELLRDD